MELGGTVDRFKRAVGLAALAAALIGALGAGAALAAHQGAPAPAYVSDGGAGNGGKADPPPDDTPIVPGA